MSDVTGTLRLLHRWLGLAVALPMISMGLSGFIMAVTPVFDDIRLPPPSAAAGAPHDAADIVDAAEGGPSAVVALDAGGHVLSSQDPRTQPWGLRVLGWLRALHTAGGLGRSGAA